MAKPISGKTSHTVGDTHDHREVTASDVVIDNKVHKRGLDISIQKSIGIPMDQADFRLFMGHLTQIVKELEQIKLQLQMITEIHEDIT